MDIYVCKHALELNVNTHAAYIIAKVVLHEFIQL